MKRFLFGPTLAALVLFSGSCADHQSESREREAVKEAMHRATQFMVEDVAVNGGYVWSYLGDFSGRWGEMEAYPSMIWTQSLGIPEMGQLFLDAYHVTGEEIYYEAAAQAADGLIAGQRESGGWNYVIDFAGEESIRKWYSAIEDGPTGILTAVFIRNMSVLI